MQVKVSTEVEAPAERVFAVLADYGVDPEWRKGVIDMSPSTPGVARRGTTTKETIRFLGSTMVTPGRVTDVVDGRVLAWEARGEKVEASGTREVVPLGDGSSRVVDALDARFNGPRRAADRVLERVARRQARGDLERLKRLVETG